MEYLLKASAVVAIFYICYRLFLQRETFFQSNRWFLLSGIIVAITIPLVVIPIYVTKEAPTILNGNFYTGNAIAVASDPTLDIKEILSIVYLLGVLILTIKFCIEFGSLIKLMVSSKKRKKRSFNYIETNKNVSPFSFFNWIVYNPQQFEKKELQQVITHEKVHASQLHSIDIILVQVASILFWFNPIIWLYKKDVQQNLEFIADSVTQEITECSTSYQQLLLKTSIPDYQLVLANNFYNSLIKKRIVMLHKQKSSKQNQLKVLFVLPLVALFLFSFNTKEIITYTETEEPIALIESVTPGNIEAIIINKNTTNDELSELSDKYEKKGIHLKFKGVKRNSAGEITSIDISAKTENSRVSFNTSEDEGIEPIKITVDIENNKISVGSKESHAIHFTDDATMSYVITDDDAKIHTSKKGDNVFFYRHSKDEHEGEHEVIEHEDGKIIIKSGAKIHDIKKIHKDKDKNVFVISGDDSKIEILADTITSKDGKFIIKDNVVVRSGKGKGNSFVYSTGKGEVIDLKGDDDKEIFFISKDAKGNIFKKKVDKDEDEIIWEDEDGNVTKSKVIVRGKGDGKVWINKGDNEVFTSTGKGASIFISDEDGKGKDPLIIVDGKEVKNKKMKDLDPDSIESINVLKGEAAEKKYGKKGKNGVVEITTKKKKD